MKLIASKRLGLVLAGLLQLSGNSHAELVVDKSIIFFDDLQSSREDVGVSNSSNEERLFVSVEGYEVEAPGTEDERLVPLQQNLKPTFIATPNKLAIDPGGSSIVRLLNLDRSGEQERVYRINFLPITKPLELESPSEGDTVAPALEIVIAYQVLAIVLPASAEANVEATRSGTNAVFTNTGNANYLLTRGTQCNPADPEMCAELPSRRVYPGNRFEFDLPYDGPFSYTVRSSSGNVAKQFP